MKIPHFCILMSPQGEEFYSAYGPMTKDPDKATRYVSRDIANRSAVNTFGGGPAFWNCGQALHFLIPTIERPDTMKRITKATHAAFLATLDAECSRLGFRKVEHPYIDGAPAYEADTRAGRYSFAPDSPIQPDDEVYIDVCGRFDDVNAARELTDCNPYSGKWNFHAGYCDEAEAREFAAHVTGRIASLA